MVRLTLPLRSFFYPQRLDLPDQRLLPPPLVLLRSELIADLLERIAHRDQPCQPGLATPGHPGFVAQQPDLGRKRRDPLPQARHGRRRHMQRHGHARTGRVEQADGFVGQLPRRQVAMRQHDGGAHRFVEHGHAMVHGEGGGESPHHVDGVRRLRLHDLQHLEAARERRILFDVTPAFAPSGGADDAQRTARKN